MSLPDEQDRRLETIAAGREATAIAGILRPYIDSRIGLLVHRMASEYRNKTADFPVLLGTAAQVACLLDLLSDLDNKSRRGDMAMAKEMQNE